MKIQCLGVLLDLDGVLVDSTPAVARVWSAWAREHGMDPEETVRKAHGRPSIATVRELLPEADAEEEDAKIERSELNDMEGMVALPGAVDLLSVLPEDRWGVVTSGTRSLASKRLHTAGLPVPKHFVTASDIRLGKPDPEPYLIGVENLEFPAADCVVVEDAPAGVRSGRAAGARVIALRTTAADDELKEAGANWIVDDLSKVSVAMLNGDGLELALDLGTSKQVEAPQDVAEKSQA
jgi:mannitol-1-/sugar-/sorbitol-6-phosphatase